MTHHYRRPGIEEQNAETAEEKAAGPAEEKKTESAEEKEEEKEEDEPHVEDEDDVIEAVETEENSDADAKDAAPPTKQKRQIVDFPGFEGTPLSLEKAVKFRFARPGTKAAERMLRVQNRLKSGTSAVPITVDEERAAGIQSGDVLFLIGKASDCITSVMLQVQFFNIASEKGLVHCSTAELKDAKTTIDGFIMHGAESPGDCDLLWLNPHSQGVAVKNVPATCTREINPEIATTDIGTSVWEVKIEDMQVLLDLHADDLSKSFRLPASPSGNFPYHSKDGTVLFVLSGSEDGSPDLT